MPPAKKRRIASNHTSKSAKRQKQNSNPPVASSTATTTTLLTPFPTSTQASRLLALPGELRNNIYHKVLEDHPIAYLPWRSNGHSVLSASSLSRVNKQLRNEFLDFATDKAPIIEAEVRGLRFGHVITFLNRLSDKRVEDLESEDSAQQQQRILNIKLTFSVLSSPGYIWYASHDAGQLKRWLNRCDKPEKKGAQIQFQYDYLHRKFDVCYSMLEVLKDRENGTRGYEEAVEIKDALVKAGVHGLMDGRW